MSNEIKVGIAHRALSHAFFSLVPNPVYIDPEVDDVGDFDLIIFTGGADISPTIYNEENKYSYGIHHGRDMIELLILQRALESSKPKIFGSCRGHQLINAYLGADFVQDIKFQLNEEHGGVHGLEKVKEGSVISKHFTTVNSLHHQGITTPGVGLTATSMKGKIIESTENRRIITTQFHPEWLSDSRHKFFSYLINTWLHE